MGNPQGPFALVGVASGIARFWLRTSIRTQEQLMTWLGDKPAATPRPPVLSQPAPETPDSGTLGSKMRELLDRALDHSTNSSRVELFHHVLDQLVADEARIISALSDGSSSPLISVQPRVQGRVVLENASLVGRTAGIALPEMVPSYVSHLLSLGLVQLGPEDADLKDDYEILMAETAILRAIKSASRGPVGPKVDKQTLTLSGLGQALWAVTMQQDNP